MHNAACLKQIKRCDAKRTSSPSGPGKPTPPCGPYKIGQTVL